MTYREATLKTSVDTIERIALVLSKRLERADLAAAIFGELVTASSATHAVLWRRDSKTESVFLADLASCRIEQSESFDASTLGFWKLWQDGSRSAYMVDNKDENLNGVNWTKYNLLLPLPASNNSILGILSLHYSMEPRSENNPFTHASLAQILVNALLMDRRVSQDISIQLQNELWLEHNHKLLLMRLNGRLDRDFVLQAAVDTLGSILKVSSCLALKTDGVSARVTHEYVDPDLSPLGLGLSASVPQAIAAQMCEKTTVLEETGIRRHEQGQYIEGMESLFESSVRSLAGTPIVMSGASLGALVVQSNRERKWMRQELQLLEGCASAISQALRNADHYQEVKEQVFNLNLVSNLTRQLSTAVEQLSRHPKEAPEEEDNILTQSSKAPPLSARELEVLRLIASGLANREIAQRLFLTESTVELHASRIRKKLKLKSRTALVKFACDNHLV